MADDTIMRRLVMSRVAPLGSSPQMTDAMSQTHWNNLRAQAVAKGQNREREAELRPPVTRDMSANPSYTENTPDRFPPDVPPPQITSQLMRDRQSPSIERDASGNPVSLRPPIPQASQPSAMSEAARAKAAMRLGLPTGPLSPDARNLLQAEKGADAQMGGLMPPVAPTQFAPRPAPLPVDETRVERDAAGNPLMLRPPRADAPYPPGQGPQMPGLQSPELTFGNMQGSATGTTFVPPGAPAAAAMAGLGGATGGGGPQGGMGGSAGLGGGMPALPDDPNAPEVYDPATGTRSPEVRAGGLMQRMFGEPGSDQRSGMSKALMAMGAAMMTSKGDLGTALGEGIQAGLATYDETLRALQEEANEQRKMGMAEEAHMLEMEIKKLQLQKARSGPIGGSVGSRSKGSAGRKDTGDEMGDFNAMLQDAAGKEALALQYGIDAVRARELAWADAGLTGKASARAPSGGTDSWMAGLEE